MNIFHILPLIPFQLNSGLLLLNISLSTLHNQLCTASRGGLFDKNVHFMLSYVTSIWFFIFHIEAPPLENNDNLQINQNTISYNLNLLLDN